MQIKKGDTTLIIAILLFVAAIGSYYFCQFSLSGKTETLNIENAALESEVTHLQDLMNHKQEYIDQTETMQAEMEDIKSQFPADIKPETQIMYANDLERNNAIFVSGVGMPGKEMVMVEAPVAAEAAPAEEAPVDDAAAAEAPVDDTAAAPAGSALASTVLLYNNKTTVEFKSTYKSIKDILKQINEDTKEKKSIDSLTLAYDNETGNLTGTLVVNMYSLDGVGTKYEEPAVTGVKSGTTNIFNTSEDANSLRTTTTDTAADGTETEDTTDSADDDETKNASESTKDAE